MRENFFEKEVLFGYTVDTEMKRRWAVSLDLLEKFMAVCNKHNLRYFAVYGTLLGAVRHKGFIPWDDDIDIAMHREDFEVLEKIAVDEFKPPYFLQTPKSDPLHFTGITRLRNSNTTHINWNEKYQRGNKGCFIDILILDSLYENAFLRKWQQWRAVAFRRMLFAKHTFYDHYYYLVNRDMKPWFVLSKLFTVEWLMKRYNNACLAGGSTRLVGVVAGSRDFCFDKDIFSGTVLMDFEHLKVPVPIGYKEFAQQIWGGFKLPNEDERVPHHGGVIDVDTPYTAPKFRRHMDTFKGITNEKIVLFGAGGIAVYYMQRHGKQYPPVCIFDNNPAKWGAEISGVLVKKPDVLPEMLDDNIRIIITTNAYREIGAQIEAMGISNYYIYEEAKKYGI